MNKLYTVLPYGMHGAYGCGSRVDEAVHSHALQQSRHADAEPAFITVCLSRPENSATSVCDLECWPCQEAQSLDPNVFFLAWRGH
jgi:hypothetical protein